MSWDSGARSTAWPTWRRSTWMPPPPAWGAVGLRGGVGGGLGTPPVGRSVREWGGGAEGTAPPAGAATQGLWQRRPPAEGLPVRARRGCGRAIPLC